MGFSTVNHLFWGTPIYGNPHFCFQKTQFPLSHLLVKNPAKRLNVLLSVWLDMLGAALLWTDLMAQMCGWRDPVLSNIVEYSRCDPMIFIRTHAHFLHIISTYIYIYIYIVIVIVDIQATMVNRQGAWVTRLVPSTHGNHAPTKNSGFGVNPREH